MKTKMLKSILKFEKWRLAKKEVRLEKELRETRERLSEL